MQRAELADQLLPAIFREHEVDIMLISEQYRSYKEERRNFYEDELGTAAIWVLKPQRLPVTGQGCGRVYVWVKSQDITYFSCYHTPNISAEEHQTLLDELEDAIAQAEGELLVGGDFNAKSEEWGDSEPDVRGRRLTDLIARQNLAILNSGTTTTFRRTGCRHTIIDVSLSSENHAANIKDWTVLEEENGSDHQYIRFDIKPTAAAHTRKETQNNRRRWNITKMNKNKFYRVLETGKDDLTSIGNDQTA